MYSFFLSDLFVSLPGEDLERLALENADINDNDMNLLIELFIVDNNEDQFIGAV